MAYTRTIITYKCPRCRADIARRFGLMSTLTITCPFCEAKVRIDRNVIAQNWGFNFAWVGGLLIWLVLGVAVIASPQFAAMAANKTLPAATLQNRAVIALFCVIPSLLAGLIIGGVGMLFGTIVAMGAAREETARPKLQQSSKGRLERAAAGPQPPRPRRRGLLVRAFFVLLWPVVFFCGAATVLGADAASAGGGNRAGRGGAGRHHRAHWFSTRSRAADHGDVAHGRQGQVPGAQGKGRREKW